MNAATEVKRHKLTQEDCDIARFFTRRGMKMKEIAKILKVDPSTVGKIQKADFRLETYLEQRKEMNRKTKERKAAEQQKRRIVPLDKLIGTPLDEERDKKILDQLVEEREAEKNGMTVEMYRFCKGLREKQDAPAEVPGQMQMDLEGRNGGDGSPVPLTRNGENRPLVPEADEQKSMMKFQAAMVDKLVKVLTEMIVTLDNRLTALDEIRDVLKGGERLD